MEFQIWEVQLYHITDTACKWYAHEFACNLTISIVRENDALKNWADSIYTAGHVLAFYFPQ